MPVATLSTERLRSLLSFPLPDVALDDLLFASKAEVEDRSGDALTLSVTPDRLDLLSEGGLSLYLSGAADAARGLPPVRTDAPAPEDHVTVDGSVDPLRPAFGAVLLSAPTEAGVDDGTLLEAIRFQELLHATVGRDRRAASLGIYPYERIVPPVRYEMAPIAELRFVPLEATEEWTAARFFRDHPMAGRYGALGRVGERCLVLRDAQGTILSLPPILNSRAAGEARAGDRRLLLESTGTRPRAVREALGLLLVVFLAQGWRATPVAVRGPLAPADGLAAFGNREVHLSSTTLRSVAGTALPSAEVERRLGRARLGVRPAPGGWQVSAPPWRPDLLAEVDLAEDAVLAGGVRPEDGTVLPSPTRGRRRPESVFRRRLRSRLLGLGFAQPHTPVLVSSETVERVGETEAIRLRNPVSAEFAVLRNRLLLSHLEVLGRNTRRGYPQRFAEVAPVLVRDPSAEAGARTDSHAGFLVAAEGAGFADAASIVDFLLRGLDVGGVREPCEVPGLVPGRGARARVAGEAVAEMGEVHPRILEGLGVPVPVAWGELDLTPLWTLARRSNDRPNRRDGDRLG